jgi:hypothetical protein
LCIPSVLPFLESIREHKMQCPHVLPKRSRLFLRLSSFHQWYPRRAE